jgi:predicted TIM-barrel fold metal-dependent hydrolase
MAAADEIIDCWINVQIGKPDPSATYLFPGMTERWEKGQSPAQLVEEMDAAGISRAIITSGWGPEDTISWVKQALREFPDRFAGSHIVDPRDGLKAVQLIHDLVRNEGYRLIRMLAFSTQVGYGDPRCYPVYSKCAELGIPVGVNVGIPGPQVPARCQDPFPLDDVCHFFPELTVVMQHGGEPWEDLCVKLMVKWPRLYYMTSAFAPKYYPEAILRFLNSSRGADKVMWASDHPILTFQRSLSEIPQLKFRDAATKAKFMGGNARKLFFSGA